MIISIFSSSIRISRHAVVNDLVHGLTNKPSYININRRCTPAAASTAFLQKNNFSGVNKHKRKKKKLHNNSLKKANPNPKPKLSLQKKQIPVPIKNKAELLLPQREVPPSFLSPTASKHAFIATAALENYDIDRDTLFLETKLPIQFLNNKFEFLPENHSVHSNHIQQNGDIPEVAFLGRSNVGKSSLVNALIRSKIAKVSKSPGRTQTMNYYAIIPRKDPRLIWNKIQGFFVDLPGYGYAEAPQKKVDIWQKRTQQFLVDRYEIGALKRLYFLIDPRHGVYQFDRVVMGWCDEANIPYSIVLTKSDKVTLSQIVKVTNEVCMRYHSQVIGAHCDSDSSDGQGDGIRGGGGGSQGPIVHVTSAKTGDGIPQFMLSIASDLWVDEQVMPDSDDYSDDDDDDDMEHFVQDK